MNVSAVESARPAPAHALSKAQGKSASRSFEATLEAALKARSPGHVVRRGETLSQICLDELKRSGARPSRAGLYENVAAVARANGLSDADYIVPGQRIDLSALTTSKHEPAAATSNVPGASSRPVLARPARLTSGYGMRVDPLKGVMRRHRGIDLAVESGTPIFPIERGQVVFSGTKNGYGNAVIVRHPGGLESLYAHNAENLVKVGELVARGTRLGLVGSSGRATGPHLHLEVRHLGRPINPLPLLRGASFQVAQRL